MKTFNRLLAVTASAAAICGAGAAGASAYAISGGAYTGTNTSPITFNLDGTYTFTCDTATYSGTATGAASTTFTPAFSDCEFFGLPGTVSQSGPWTVTITGGPTSGAYTGSLSIPSGTTTTLSVPLAGCVVTFDSPQTFGNSTTFTNTIPGVGIEITVTNISYTAVGCPFGSSIHGTYTGTVDFPGVTVS